MEDSQKGSPFGFTVVGSNWLKRNKLAQLLKEGVITDEDIIKDFDDMRKKLKFKSSPPMENDKGELKTFPAKSRWNDEYNYGGVVGARALDQVKGLKDVCHLVLTISKAKCESMVPAWWAYDVEDYMALRGGEFVTEYLRKYRAYRAKKGANNRFVTWVMEFQQNGMVHFHLLFYGRYIAPLPDLVSWWAYSDPNGVRLGKPIKHNYGGDALANYLTKYITKDLKIVCQGRQKRTAAFLWFFKRRLYNMRHHIKNSDGKYTLGIGRDAFKSTWQRVYNEDEKNKMALNDAEFERMRLECEADRLLMKEGDEAPYRYYWKRKRLCKFTLNG
jgi:hypothetical protein